MKKLTVIIIAMSAMMACKYNNVNNWSDDQVEKWFAQSPWNTGLSIKPDASIDKREFATQYINNTAAWDAAFRFLTDNDLSGLAPGNYSITDDGVYAAVSEYMTKESAHFEAHRKYVDVQLVISGREYIDLTDSKERYDLTPFNEKDDYELFQADEFTRHIADTTRFFIFFPDDPHKPGMKIDESSSVKKAVIKIPYITVR